MNFLPEIPHPKQTLEDIQATVITKHIKLQAEETGLYLRDAFWIGKAEILSMKHLPLSHQHVFLFQQNIP